MDCLSLSLSRYLYPSGYTTLRPRGGPWKLSLIIFVFFIWLCVFIVGHCSDQADMAAGDDAVANDQNDQNDVNDGQQANYDDEFIIATRWCGSRTLYSMWVVTVLITGTLEIRWQEGGFIWMFLFI